ncbi:hypothetical protein PAAG_01867 [Paracoccidioides lutzii Pb01]|uniref:Uncharacterized protein n=1 Tax=Paracoccidioides lutzii (strain ATCC MYA-826 / Pb01) TaxID=502779 RepID=C1GTM2_PARBA|nr:hypothetical protein PAAG_01867 [Paracoccidioides lutzii Pb01]EEH39678.2 hypothetical protein PAAG_01867 [Paracoccidioides lutzii Pb01]
MRVASYLPRASLQSMQFSYFPSGWWQVGWAVRVAVYFEGWAQKQASSCLPTEVLFSCLKIYQKRVHSFYWQFGCCLDSAGSIFSLSKRGVMSLTMSLGWCCRWSHHEPSVIFRTLSHHLTAASRPSDGAMPGLEDRASRQRLVQAGWETSAAVSAETPPNDSAPTS